MSNSNQSDEINFEPFFNLLLSVFNGIVLVFKRLFLALRKSVFLIIVGSIIVAGMGFGVTYLLKPKYNVQMVVTSSFFNRQMLVKELETLDVLVKDENFDLLSKKLNVSKEKAMLIASIEASDERLYLDSKDTSGYWKNLMIEAVLFNTSVAKDLEKGIIMYLESNPYALSQKKLKKRSLEGQISRMKENLLELDTLVDVITNGMNPENLPSSGFVFSEPLNPTNLIKESEGVYSRMLKYENELMMLDNMQVVKEFTPLRKPSFPKKTYFTACGFGLGFLLFWLIAIVRYKDH